MAVHNSQLLTKVPLQHKGSVPRCAVLHGEDKAFLPAADVRTQCVHNLNRNRNVSERVRVGRRFQPVFPDDLDT
ncbi:MAG: hypothetical protein DMG30_25755 [Acidobacteria bacterium]|nr:MAG: hypothetical protein DMG30_25755 [Acidobacteriota bacterium]